MASFLSIIIKSFISIRVRKVCVCVSVCVWNSDDCFSIIFFCKTKNVTIFSSIE